MSGRILGVDQGDKRIGLAVSDPSATIASPLQVLMHVSRVIDAAQIVNIGAEYGVARFIVGLSSDDEGVPTPQGRKAVRLADAIRQQTNIPVEMWDESFSTTTAREARIAMGVKRDKRKGHLDDLAATVILQSYLDTLRQSEGGISE